MNYRVVRKLQNEGELYHHGVKGMKWGIRHDPERVGRRRRSSNGPENFRRRGRPQYRTNRKSNIRKWLKRGAIAAAAGLAIYGGYKLYKSGKLGKAISAGKNLVSKTSKIKRLNAALPDGTINMSAVNNMNPTNNNMNCCFTSTGYIINKITGKDVMANEFSEDLLPGLTEAGGTSPQIFDLMFDGIKRTKTNPRAKSYYDLPTMAKTCSKIKDNSRGIMFVQKGPMGHYVNYEKVNGAMRIVDCQGNSVTGNVVDTVSKWDLAQFRPIEIIDCTNATISDGGENYLNKILKGLN